MRRRVPRTRAPSRRWWVANACLLTLACAVAPRPRTLPEVSPGAPEWTVVVSVAGLTARAMGIDMPALGALAASGALAAQVEGVAPAASYPAHATLLTGFAPASHGVVADRRLGERGVRDARYAHASHLKVATLWQRVFESGRAVASLAWPSTLGAAIPLLLPDLPSERREKSWSDLLQADTTPALHALVLHNGGARDGARTPGALRDAVLVGVACDLLGDESRRSGESDGSGESAPPLLLLRLAQTAEPLERHGPASREAAAAFASVDREIARLLDCLAAAGRLSSAALVVLGDHGVAAVHTEVAPNAELARASLVEGTAAGVTSWSAIARSNGGSAFVYARDERAALRARKALETAATDSGAFRIVPAEEMRELAADSEAWFGLEAEPGFAFRDVAAGPLLSPSARRGAGGYLPGRAEMDAVFVAWGRGFRPGIRIPQMRQTDVAPTLARLLDVRLQGAAGRVLVGVLSAGAGVSGAGGGARDGR